MFWLFLSFMFSFYTTLPCCFISQPIATIGINPSAVAFSADGTCLAVANYGLSTITIYSSSSCSGYSSASLVATISDGISFPAGVALSADGTCLAVANQPLNGSTGSITLYSSQTCAGYDKASPVTTITNGINVPGFISFSANGSCLAVANGGNNTVTIYNSSSCSGYSVVTPTVIQFTNELAGAALSPDGTCLAVTLSTGFLHGKVELYSAMNSCGTYNYVTTLPGLNNPEQVSFSQNGACLAVADQGTNSVKIYKLTNCSSPSQEATISTDIESPIGVAFSQDPSCLAVANASGNVTLYSPSNSSNCSGYDGMSPCATITYGIQVPVGISFSPSGTCLAVSNNGLGNSGLGNVTLFSSQTCIGFNNVTPLTTITSGVNQPSGVSFSQNGLCLAVGNLNANDTGSVLLYAASNCNQYGMVTPTQFQVFTSPSGLSFSHDGGCLAVADEGEGNVPIFSVSNCNTLSKVATITNGNLIPSGVAFTQNDSCLAVSYNQNNQVAVYGSMACDSYDATPSIINDSTISDPRGLAFSTDGSCLAVANFSGGTNATGSISLYTSTTQPVCAGYSGATPSAIITNGIYGPSAVAFSPNGSCIAVANQNGTNISFYTLLNPTVLGPNVVCQGTAATLIADVSPFQDTSTPTYLSYQWQRGGMDISGATDNTYTTDSTLAPGSYSYSVKVTDPSRCGPVISPSFTVIIETIVGTPASFNACLGVPLNGTVTATSSSGSPITSYNFTEPSHGQLASLTSNNGSFVYTSNTPGNDSFTFTATDGICTSAPATVTIAVDSVIGTPASFSTCSGVALNGNVTATSSSGSPITTYNFSQPGNGQLSSLTSNDGSFVYTPNTGYMGSDSFTFTATDGICTSAPATVTIAVDGVIGTPASFSTCSGVALQGTISAASSSGSPITTYTFTQPGHGQLGSLTSSDGSFIYTSNSGFSGSDSFAFTATDANGCVSAPATVTIAVDSVVGTPASFSTCSGVALQGTVSATSSSGSAITTYNFSQPGHGQLSSLTSPVGSFVYTSNSGFSGSDSFTFTATDANGCVSAPATVTINVDNAAVVLSSLGVLPNVGVPVTLVATPTAGIAPFTFKWSDGLVQTGSSAVSRVVEPVVTTSYSVIIIDSKGCQSDPSNTLTVSEITRSSLSQALQAKYCVAG